MIRLSKITDYGILILAELVRLQAEAAEAHALGKTSSNARALANRVELPLPMVSKVLKSLTRAGILESQRGAQGGYALARRPEELTVVDIIDALEGPVALTECSAGPHVCDHEDNCAVRGPLLVINHVIRNALAGITLSDMVNPVFSAQLVPLSRRAQTLLKTEGSITVQLSEDDSEFTSLRNEN